MRSSLSEPRAISVAKRRRDPKGTRNLSSTSTSRVIAGTENTRPNPARDLGTPTTGQPLSDTAEERGDSAGELGVIKPSRRSWISASMSGWSPRADVRSARSWAFRNAHGLPRIEEGSAASVVRSQARTGRGRVAARPESPHGPCRTECRLRRPCLVLRHCHRSITGRAYGSRVFISQGNPHELTIQSSSTGRARSRCRGRDRAGPASLGRLAKPRRRTGLGQLRRPASSTAARPAVRRSVRRLSNGVEPQ